MENQNQYPPQQPHIIIVKSGKSVGVAILLSFLLGPLGMLYSTISGGIIMMVVCGIVALITLGFGLFFMWPVCIIWAAIAASNHNKRLGL